MGFQDNLFKRWFTPYHKANDSYKDANGVGLLERIIQAIGWELDTNVMPYIDNLFKNTIDPKNIQEKLIAYREQELGVNLMYDNTLQKRRQILQYWFRIVQIKGTKRGYEVCIRLMNFEGLIIFTVDVETYFNNPIPTAGCNACYEYDVVVTGSKLIIGIDIVDAFFNICDFNEPINCKLRYFIYNDTYIPRKLVNFFFKGIDDPNLYVDIKRNPTFQAFFDTNTDNQGDLLLLGDFAEFYEYDDKYFANQGFMMYREPTPAAYLPFVSLTPTEITTTSARMNWQAAPDATHYVVNVGRNSTYQGNELVTEKVIDNLNVGNVLFYNITGLIPNTPYYCQVWAVRADGKQALSNIKSFITLRDIATPIALEATNLTPNGFKANWQEVNNATNYEIEIALDSGFTNIVQTFIVGNITSFDILINQECFYRVRAIYQKMSLPSYSSWSNTISTSIMVVGGLKFDGLLHHVNVPYNSYFDPCESIKPFTIFIDFYQTGGLKLIHTQLPSTDTYKGFYINIYPSSVIFGHNILTTSCTVSYSPLHNTRRKLAIVADTANMQWHCYIDGDLQGSFAYDFISPQATGSWQIGGYFRDQILQQFKGVIFSVQYFNRALPLGEVQTLTNGGNVTSGKLFEYKLDENEGFVAKDSVNNVNATLQNYTLTQVSLGSQNHWVDENRNPKT
jgi:hypothetical protein